MHNMYMFAKCPHCQRENTLAVRVGKKSTAQTPRTAQCATCGSLYNYSCWVIKRNENCIMHRIDLFNYAALDSTTYLVDTANKTIVCVNPANRDQDRLLNDM